MQTMKSKKTNTTSMKTDAPPGLHTGTPQQQPETRPTPECDRYEPGQEAHSGVRPCQQALEQQQERQKSPRRRSMAPLMRFRRLRSMQRGRTKMPFPQKCLNRRHPQLASMKTARAPASVKLLLRGMGRSGACLSAKRRLRGRSGRRRAHRGL